MDIKKIEKIISAKYSNDITPKIEHLKDFETLSYYQSHYHIHFKNFTLSIIFLSPKNSYFNNTKYEILVFDKDERNARLPNVPYGVNCTDNSKLIEKLINDLIRIDISR